MSQPAEQLVGRAAELVAFDQALSELERGRPAALELAGEPGIGKTRLLSELSARGDERSLLVLSGSASELEGDIPFWVFVDALDEYVEGLAPHRLDCMDPDARAELGHVLPSLASGGAAPAVERFRTHRAMRQLLETLAVDKPLVLLLDDLHWADSGSVELLGTLLRRPPGAAVLLAMGVRPRQIAERLSAALVRARRIGTLTRLELAGLSADESRQLLGDAVAGPAAAKLFAESAGNPFYLQQLLRSPAAGVGSEETSLGGVDVPRAVAVSLTEELATLTPAARTALEGAAVAGDPFEPELAAAAAGVPEPAALAALDELLARDLVRATDVPRRFAFRHPLVRRAVYEAAPGGWRLGAHERSAAALAARGAPAAARAHHVEHAGRHGDAAAVAVLREAGEAVVHRTPAGAARWFAAALRLLPASATVEERTALLIASAGALAAAGRFPEARVALLETEGLVAPEAVATRAECAISCALVDGLMGRHAAAQARLESVVGVLDELAAPQAVALLLQLEFNAIYRQAYGRAREWAARADAIARRDGDPPLRAAAGAALGLTEAMVGPVREAKRRCDEAALVFDAMPDDDVAAWVGALSQLSVAELYLDRVAASVERAGRALDVARATGQVQLFPMFAPMMGHGLLLQGRLAEATELLDGACEAARLSGSPHALGWVLHTRTLAALQRGDLSRALADGQEGLDLGRELDVGNVVSSWLGLAYGSALVEAGDPGRALDVALDLAGGADLPLVPGAWRAYFLERLTPAWLALGRHAEADRAAAEAEAVAAATGLGFAETAARRARARVALYRGDASAAAETALTSAAAADELGAPVEAALSRTIAGGALARAGEPGRATALLERAAAALDGCGAVRYRDEAERELGKLGRRRHRRTRAGSANGGVESLTERELQVARLIVDRRTNAQIAAELFLSRKTVETHVRNLFHKLAVSSRVDVARAVERAERASR